jgi:hypothetical protein
MNDRKMNGPGGRAGANDDETNAQSEDQADRDSNPAGRLEEQQSTPLAPLCALPSWVGWRYETVKDRQTKVPYQVRRPDRKASTTDPETWATYAEAEANRARFDGLGFVLTGTEFAAFDIDDCRDPATEKIHPWAQRLVERARSYCEVTISGTGLRIIGIGTGPEVHRKQPVADGVTLETYRQAKRYIAMTWNQLNGAGLQNIDAVIDAVVSELDKDKPKAKAQFDTGGKKELPQELRVMLYLTGDAPADYPSRSELFYAFINAAFRKGIDENVIIDTCVDETYRGGSIYEHVQQNGGANYVKRQIERTLNKIGDGNSQRPIRRVEEGKLDEDWRWTQQMLIEKKCPVFVRGRRLVQPLWRWEKTEEGARDVLAAAFVSYNAGRLADVAAHQAKICFQVYDGRRKERWKNVDPPAQIMSRLIEIGHWSFPDVVGIVNSPTMRRDGSLLMVEGYDPATGLWFKSSGDVDLPPIPERPTREDAEVALKKLDELLAGFPFDSDVSRSVALAGMLTTVLRASMRAVPIFAIVAPEARTGKTYLAKLISVLATGHFPVPTAGSRNPEEMEKRIETAALSGRPILHLNNLPNGMTLESEAPSQLATEGEVIIRKLGTMEEGKCDCRATTILANGNNILIAADLVPRTPICRLDAKTDRPEARTFVFDPIERVRADRGAYLAAVFTIARGFKAAGSPKPEQMRVVAGFEEWSRAVQQPLMWLGMADPFGNMGDARAMDPTTEELQQLIDVLKKYVFGAFTVADCEKLAEEQEADPFGRVRYKRLDLRELMTIHGRINSKSFGRLLMRHRDRRIGDCYIQFVSNQRGRVTYRLIGAMEEPAGRGEEPTF